MELMIIDNKKNASLDFIFSTFDELIKFVKEIQSINVFNYSFLIRNEELTNDETIAEKSPFFEIN